MSLMESFFSAEELNAAQKAIVSTLRKNEKARETLSAKEPPRAAQIGFVTRQLETLCTMSALVQKALGEGEPAVFSPEALGQVLLHGPALIRQVEQVRPKFREGTPQHTLAVRRIRAFQIALELAEREQEK